MTVLLPYSWNKLTTNHKVERFSDMGIATFYSSDVGKI